MMETNEILNRIKLMMNYDSKRTLTENRLLINEETQEQIIQKLIAGGALRDGTSEGELEYAIRMIQRTVTSWTDFQKLDGEIKTKTGRTLQELLNNELGNGDTETVKVIVDLLNKTPGLSASYKTHPDKYDNQKKYFTEDSITITQKSGGQTTNEKPKENTQQGNFPSCITNVKQNYPNKVQSSPSNKGGISIKFVGDTAWKTYYPYIGPNYGRYIDGGTNVVGYYYCDGRGIKLGLPQGTSKSTANAATKKQQNKGGGTSWVQSPSCEDVVKGTVTIKMGMKGDCVGKIQTKLIEKGFNEVGTPDNKFGKNTEAAVISLQKKAGLTYNGVVDKATYNYLFFDTTNTETPTLQTKNLQQIPNTVADQPQTIPTPAQATTQTTTTATTETPADTQPTQTGTQQISSGGKRKKGGLRNLFRRNK